MTSTPREGDQNNTEDYNEFTNNRDKTNNGRNEEEEGERGEEETEEEAGGNDMQETLYIDEGNRKVVIEWDTIKKPFLGGFRHKQTGVEYHHASTQTYRPTSLRVLQKMLITKYHRDTQTTETAHNKTQPLRECGTQMARTGLYISDEGSKTMAPRPYFSADQLFDLKTRKAIKIQCMARRWFAKRKVQRLREDRAKTEEQLAVQQEEKQRELDSIRQREIERRRNPRTKEDFDVLYRELEAWHQQETARIVESTEEGSETRKGEMYALLQTQTQLLQTIDRLKLQAAKANQGPKVAKNLAQMAAPKQWGGGGVQVTTPFTKRAEELMVLYHGLKEPLLTVDQRLDVLLHVKWTVKEFSTQLTKDIIELIDREADLLNRGRSEKSVEALRQRISNMFLRFIETPDFNPEAANLKTNKIKKVST
eukprot:Phypoly_transcript_09860.p1 GENE.Phypoly_transcript_09860~~Phypoly_transcript_09860.p1  ORF type:complete len:436 (+),score=95.01 Phypoly_transcript_09860:40-1308(+)